jgi:tetratricopeptide (TPR) repeat protein
MRWLTAKTWLLEQETNPSARAKGLSDLMRSFPASPMAPLWASSYLEGLADGTKPDSTLLDPILASTPVILKDPTLGEFGLTPHDVLYTRAEVLEALERKDEAKAAWKEMADSLRERQKTLPKGVSGRSVALPLISALEFSGQPDAALALASDYRKRFPKDPTFHRKAAGVLKRAQRMPEALAVAKEAYALSYGDNLLMNAQLLAELQLSSGQPAAARETIEKATTDFKGDKKLTPRTKRYLDALNKMLPKTAAATPPDL